MRYGINPESEQASSWPMRTSQSVARKFAEATLYMLHSVDNIIAVDPYDETEYLHLQHPRAAKSICLARPILDNEPGLYQVAVTSPIVSIANGRRTVDQTRMFSVARSGTLIEIAGAMYAAPVPPQDDYALGRLIMESTFNHQ